MLPNDIRFAETKPLNEGRTSFLAVTCCYASVEGLAGFAGWNWLAVRITVSLCCSFYGSSLRISLFRNSRNMIPNRLGDSLKNRPVITTPHLYTFAPRLTRGPLFVRKIRYSIPSRRISTRRFPPCRIQFRSNSLMRGGSVKRSIIWHDPLCIPAQSTTQANYFRLDD